MPGSARIAVPIAVLALFSAGLTVGASPAIASPTPPVPKGHYSVSSVPTTQVRVPKMFAYSGSHFAAAAAALPTGLVGALGRDLHESAETYLANADAAARAVQVVDGLRASGVTVLGSRISGTKLTVNVARGSDAAAVTAAGATAVVGAPAAFSPEATLQTNSAIFPGEPYYSTFNSVPGLLAQCTLGFTGYRVTSSATPTDEPLSAGHCMYWGSHFASHSSTVAPSAPGSVTSAEYKAGTRFATPKTAKFGGGYDSGLLTTSSGVSETPQLATWGGDDAEGAPNSTTPIAITGETQAIVGATLCKSGTRTGFTCGQILAVNYTAKVRDDANKIHTVNAIIATTCSEPGDSGGGAVIGSLAAGIDSFSTTQYGCGNSHFYSGFFPLVASSTHASVKKQYGSSWELQVSLSAPAISHPASSGTTLHSTDTLTGTVPNPATGDYVAIYLDGATTTSRTATVASNGAWSYPLTTVPGGSHSVVVETRFGKYSASSPVSTSYTQIPGATVTKPRISGTAKVGSTLSAAAAVTPSTGTLSYQWRAGDTDVGTDQSTYVPVAGDIGKTITVAVTAAASGWDTSAPVVSSATKSVVHGTLTTHRVVVSGARNVGQTLTATTAAWAPDTVVLTYQWLRNGKKITTNGTGASYTQLATDHGARIDVTVTGTLAGYSTVTVSSSKTKTATANPLFDEAPAPTIDNAEPAVKDVLTAIPGTWAPGAVTFTYQWRVSGHAISKATKATYAIPSSYLGRTISVTVTGHETGFTTTSRTSAATAPVAAN